MLVWVSIPRLLSSNMSAMNTSSNRHHKDTGKESTREEHIETVPSRVEGGRHVDKKWEKKTIRKVDRRLLIIRGWPSPGDS